MAVSESANRNAGHDVLLLQLAGDLPLQLPEVLHQNGFATRIVTDLSELVGVLKELNQPILVMDSGQEEEKSVKYVKSIIEIKEVHKVPLILVGHEVDSYERVLNKYFTFATTLVTPCTSSEVVDALTYIVKNYRGPTPAKDEKEVPSVNSAALSRPPEITGDGSQEEDVSRPVHALYASAESIPDLIFARLSALQISEKKVGGTNYIETSDHEYLKKTSCLPSNKKILEIIDGICKNAGKWGGLHLHRAAFVCDKLVEALKLPNEAREQARVASFLFSWSVIEKDRSILRKDYLGTHGLIVRKELCSRVKDSAMRIALELEDRDIANIVATVGRLIGREELPGDDTSSIVASAVMAADLCDRVCFNSGFWNGRAAYSQLRKLKQGKVKEIHPAVLSVLVKFLSETISARTGINTLPKKVRENAEFLEESRRVREEEVGPHEMKVPLGELSPGMRLSRPLSTFDGKLLLTPDIILDQDLIWRIWQLSAIRPINAPLVVMV